MNYTWKILDVFADKEVITSVKYHCVGFDGENSVETEGYVTFDEPEGKIPFSEVTEEMVAKWVEEATSVGGECLIKKRLAEQIAVQKPVVAPWKPQVFTLEKP
jgi:hypothetical protein